MGLVSCIGTWIVRTRKEYMFQLNVFQVIPHIGHPCRVCLQAWWCHNYNTLNAIKIIISFELNNKIAIFVYRFGRFFRQIVFGFNRHSFFTKKLMLPYLLRRLSRAIFISPIPGLGLVTERCVSRMTGMLMFSCFIKLVNTII